MNNSQIAHSAEFISEMKEKIEKELSQIKQELDRVSHQEHSDYVANFPEYGRSDEENVNEIADYTVLNATTEALESRLEELEAALLRIKDGTYGITPEGEIIPENRLQANPAATTLVK
jgi:RNA polymerase-binding transcription factor DksA